MKKSFINKSNTCLQKVKKHQIKVVSMYFVCIRWRNIFFFLKYLFCHNLFVLENRPFLVVDLFKCCVVLLYEENLWSLVWTIKHFSHKIHHFKEMYLELKLTFLTILFIHYAIHILKVLSNLSVSKYHRDFFTL